MARTHKSQLGATLALLIGGTLAAASPSRAEGTPAPAIVIAPPPFNPACAVPNSDIAAPSTLPVLAAALKERKAARLLAIGSSSTAGVGASSSDKTYPARLEVVLESALNGADLQIINRGASGETADVAAERLRGEVALTKPDVVLWQLGTNDALARVPVAQFEDTVRSAVAWLKENRIDVVLVGMQYTPRLARDPNYASIRESLKRIATEQNVLYVRRYDAMRYIEQAHANLELMSRDNFHLNDLGYECMAEHVAHAMILSLFPAKPRRSTE
ncbi:SGNH/GDSL hydrolase family protein [Methylocystis bryophila]|uniref:GDSL family lipase n=1 Tax=Methylocystis bryophila TaxID=655015 RepID=A0A1W6MUG7_9HYPH|nr:GDSL-type esterase/lipase family protein [Methylocystis bryophila]ARN81207.1 GDSL family lipase [Methylocystis bryophila]